MASSGGTAVRSADSTAVTGTSASGAHTMTSCSARFLGRKPVHGALNDLGLSLLVSELRKSSKAPEDVRCNISVGDKRLLITYTKRDEGFFESSDGELSSSSPSPPKAKSAALLGSSDVNVEEKIIKDHVFQQQLLSDDSCGGDSSDEQLLHQLTAAPSNGSTTSGTSSKSTSPTAEIQKDLYKFDHSESIPISDVLFCHTDRQLRTCLVWVIRSRKQELEAIVFECAAEDDVRSVCNKFLELSKRSKLERHRRRKSDGGGSSGGSVSRSVEALFRSRGDKVRSLHLNSVDISLNGSSSGQAQQAHSKSLAAGNITTTTSPTSGSSSKGIDLVKYDSPPKVAGLSNNLNYNLVQHTDKNGVTHIEVESSHRTAASAAVASKPPTSGHSGSKEEQSDAKASTAAGTKSNFARELENILSKELEARGKASSSSSKSKSSANRGAVLGESLSLRQRAPALLLKKLDEFEEKAARVWAKAEAQEEEEERSRRLWGHGQGRHPSKMASRTPPPPSKRHHGLQNGDEGKGASSPAFWKGKFRPAGLNDSSSMSSPSLGHKARAPSPPAPFLSSQQQPASPSVTPKKEAAAGGGSEKQQILVPTKTGKEPVKKLYPKEINPEMQSLQMPRFIQLPPGTPIQFTAQPNSLPILQVPIAWTRYPAEMIPVEQQAASIQWARTQVLQLPPTVGGSVAARGRSRDRARIDTEQRRRAQSKSPARRPASTIGTTYDPAENSAILLPSDGVGGKSKSNNISRKFREFSDAVRLKMSRGQPKSQNLSSDAVDGKSFQPQTPVAQHPQHLKSNLKKQSESSSGGGSDAELSNTGTNGDSNKKVHFNKFATVQMME